MKLVQPGLGAEKLISILGDQQANVHWGQSAEDAVLQRFVGDKREGFYVDVGAHHPRRFSNTHLFHSLMGWRGINVDASEDFMRQFRRERPDDINITSLVGKGGEEASFTEFAFGARNSADPDRVARLEKEGFEVKAKTVMPLKSLAGILEEHLPDGQEIDIMSVDVEDLDLAVLQSNDWTKYRPALVCVEDFGIRAGKDKTPIAEFMNGVGYHLASHCYDSSIYRRVSKVWYADEIDCPETPSEKPAPDIEPND